MSGGRADADPAPDEPFTGIDPVTIHSIQEIVFQHRDSGIAILLTDHRERETPTIADRKDIICAGQVPVEGDVKTVLNDPDAHEYSFGKRFDKDSIINSSEDMKGQTYSQYAA